ncbi:MAG: type II CRISPR-associated endonuclease Cas1 [Oscillospiraceae bacterium]|nr:type II CRISPR-associated endonuclease Cas1 [Oscillospiraceae bacterium]
MSWRTVVISRRAKLELRLGYLVVRDELQVNKVHLSELSQLIIENTSVSVTAALLAELAERKIKIIFCDDKRNPSSELVPYYGSHDTSLKVKQQVLWSENIKAAVWTEIVSEKIRNQALLLQKLRKDEALLLHQYIEQIELGDVTNREGHAAKVYFNALFGKEFSRTRDCIINAALNYGYSILLSAFNREVVSNGFITQLGLFHGNRFNQFNLSSDLMEPFRPLVDETVIDMELEGELSHDDKMSLVNILNREVIIDGREHYINNAIKIYCRSVFDALCENDISLMRFFGG